MLDRIREGTQGPVVKTILFIIILAFAFTGVSAYLGGSVDDYVAKVNDKEISRADFDRAYQSQRATMEQQFGEMFSLLAADENYMREMRVGVLEQMIEEELAVQLASEMGLAQSANALRNAIRQMPEFQLNGQFSNDMYLRQLSNAGFSPTMFRDYLQQQMSRVALMQGAFGSEFVLDNESERLQVLQNERRSGRYALISVDDYISGVELTDAEIEEFYFENQDAFRQEERIQLAYVELSFSDVLATIEVDDAEVRAYYDSNPGAFSSQESRSIAHILVEFGESEDAALERIREIQSRLEAGEDFAELAANESDDIFSGQDGGELGLLERDTLDPDLEDAGFALSAEGEVSDVVRSEFGYHLVKLTDLSAAATTSFAEVADDIRANIAQAEAERVYFEQQQELARISFEVDHTLAEAAEALGLTVQTSPWISRAEAVAGFDDTSLLQQAFSADVSELGLNSELIELDDRSLVVRASEYVAPRVQDLADVRADIESYLAAEKAEGLAAERAQEVLAMVEAGESVDGIEFIDIQSATRFGSNLPGAVRQQLFRMPVSGASEFAQVTLGNGDAAIIELIDMQPGVVDDEDAERSKRQLESQYAELAYRAVMDALKANATIQRRL
ncbi:parvulin-like peptidyl-prolyl isomerase [Idiomarina sp. A28L]|uniref:SurA N-terminal domain-containing protein n=1 Tax=Idiomarina sp. A28L TaxID=1036674 RepID=UPI000213860E|nr:SurA N-terminal domain-containing protein [Idiomarina sp. A28L]EGN76337.1 parvulin-like peptidyl-prolyl isomerase [Idiomarina sp. A28L]